MALFKAFDGAALNLRNFFRCAHGFLICNGPSMAEADKDLLSKPGIVTMGLNNGPSVFRPNLWIMGDDVHSFVRSIWLDPKIIKFAPWQKRKHQLFHNDDFRKLDTKVGDCPSMVYFERNYKFNPKTWLSEDTINWGCQKHICPCGYEAPGEKRPSDKKCPECGAVGRFGHYNIIYLAIKTMYSLGFRRVNIVGADFHMSKDKTYAFPQKRHRQSVRNNNGQYEEANRRFDTLRPIFEKDGFHVYNCYKDSGLKSFDYKPLGRAVEEACASLPPAVKDQWGVWVCSENTRDLYDRKHDEKQRKRRGQGAGCTLDEFLAMREKK